MLLKKYKKSLISFLMVLLALFVFIRLDIKSGEAVYAHALEQSSETSGSSEKNINDNIQVLTRNQKIESGTAGFTN